MCICAHSETDINCVKADVTASIHLFAPICFLSCHYLSISEKHVGWNISEILPRFVSQRQYAMPGATV